MLKGAGIAAAMSSCWTAGLLAGSAAPQSPQDGARQALDALLQQHRNRVVALDGRIGGTLAHVPLALMAMYRIGASPEQMQRFFGDRTFPAPSPGQETALTVEDWRRHLRTGVSYARWFAFFDSWLEQAPFDTVLAAALPTLIEGGVSAFDHTLIHMGYAIDHGERHELAQALASWASTRGADQQVDLAPDAVEPDALLAAIVECTRDLQLSPRGGNSGPIQWRLDQVQRQEEYSRQLKPVRIPAVDPLKKFAEIILDLFCETHEFTMLHALTTCQALRLLLPYVSEPKKTLSAYWHSVCASYVTVRRMPQFEAAKQRVPSGEAAWTEILPKAPAGDATIQESQYVHRVKLVFSCQQESKHYGRDLYRAVAAREVDRASHIILG
jgi:hypothetical protein